MKFIAMFLLVLSGCATTGQYKKNCDRMIWASEESLVRTFGIPDGSYESNGTKYLKYRTQRTQAITLQNYVAKGSNDPAETTHILNRGCETMFIVRDGFVESYSFEGNDCVAQ